MASKPGSSDNPFVGHVIHPDVEKYHKSFGTSSKDIRDRRNRVKLSCPVCFKCEGPEFKLRLCAKCNHVRYCSKECQKKDWPLHKTSCSNVNASVNVGKIAEILHASSFLNTNLQCCFVLAFDLINQPRLNKPFVARLDLGVEPTEIIKFSEVYTGRHTDSPIPGMVQLNAFKPIPDSAIQEDWKLIWRQTKEAAESAGFPDATVCILLVSKSSGLFSIFPYILHPSVFDLVRRTPTLTCTSALTGKVTEMPFDLGGCLEMMNKHIRADNKDRLSLRTEMTAADIITIRDAALGNVQPTRPADQWAHFAAKILKEKMAREALYKLTIVKAPIV
ncbi:hypothetical protein B0H11DRAFT_646961 [Mycena galericulata]|nr:hypothetical protein B0H11DRAFT_646961 [Mycena galericulata]